MIYDLYSKACPMNGTYSPELAVGVRAAAEAYELLGIDENDHDLYCVAEGSGAYLDGIQTVFCTTVNNETLEIRNEDRIAFTFSDRTTGKAVRLCAIRQPETNPKALVDQILTAPLETIFSVEKIA